MYSQAELDEYLDEIRRQVCTRCVIRPQGGPPCQPLGVNCGVELHLHRFIDAVHQVESPLIEPYLENNRLRVCTDCANKGHSECPCPMDYLLVLIMQAIESVDERKKNPTATPKLPLTQVA